MAILTRQGKAPTKIKDSVSYTIFTWVNYCIMLIAAIICVFPLLNIFAISLSSKYAVTAGKVFLWPVDFSLEAYHYLLANTEFWRSIAVSILRVVVTLILAMFINVCTAYPLSKQPHEFYLRTAYRNFFFFTMIFGAGMVPVFLVVKAIGLLGHFAAIILPGLVGFGNIILLMNFIRQLPQGIEESALIDGASTWQTLTLIVLPMCKASLATIGLFIMVGTWNEWFSAIIYLNDTAWYPLQTYLRGTLLNENFKAVTQQDVLLLSTLSNKTIQAAQLFVGMIPILIVYPLLQKHFAKGIVLGSVKG